LEGRWAQLAIDAHIAHAIDYSKPINPIAEYAIHQRLELDRKLAVAQMYPHLNEQNDRVELSGKWVESMKKRLLAWTFRDGQVAGNRPTKAQMEKGMEFLDKINNRKKH
jgi:hypothetical protein